MKISISRFLIIDLILYNQLVFFVLLVFDNINLLWFSLNIIISCCILLFYPKISKKFNLVLIFGFIIISNYLLHESSKITSVIFSASLVFTSVVQLGFIHDNMLKYNFSKYINNTIFLFFLFYLLQVVFNKFGIIDLNIFGLSEENYSIFRYNSLMSEPSYSSTVMVCLLFVNQIINKNKKIITEIIGLLFIILCQSLFGIILYFIYQIIYHKKYYKNFFYAEIFVLLFVFIFLFSSEYLARIKTIFDFLIQSDIEIFDLVKIEPSGAFRIIPFIAYLQIFEWNLFFNYLFGFGSGASESFLNYELFKAGYGTSQFGGSFQGGFFPGFIIDYGILVTVFFMFTLKKVFLLNRNFFQYFILFAIFINVNINTQLFWFPLFLFFITKYYEKDFS